MVLIQQLVERSKEDGMILEKDAKLIVKEYVLNNNSIV